jgi:hypothetical protein
MPKLRATEILWLKRPDERPHPVLQFQVALWATITT